MADIAVFGAIIHSMYAEPTNTEPLPKQRLFKMELLVKNCVTSTMHFIARVTSGSKSTLIILGEPRLLSKLKLLKISIKGKSVQSRILSDLFFQFLD